MLFHQILNIWKVLQFYCFDKKVSILVMIHLIDWVWSFDLLLWVSDTDQMQILLLKKASFGQGHYSLHNINKSAVFPFTWCSSHEKLLLSGSARNYFDFFVFENCLCCFRHKQFWRILDPTLFRISHYVNLAHLNTGFQNVIGTLVEFMS